MYVCLCNAITESQVKKAGAQGIIGPHDLIEHFKLDDDACCGYCRKNIDFFVEIAAGEDALAFVRHRAEHPGIPGRQ